MGIGEKRVTPMVRGAEGREGADSRDWRGTKSPPGKSVKRAWLGIGQNKGVGVGWETKGGRARWIERRRGKES